MNAIDRPPYRRVRLDQMLIEAYYDEGGGYQRVEPRPKWVEERTGKNFNPDLIRTLEVADLSHENRPGFFAVIDGQGRMKLLQVQQIEEAYCHVHYDTTKAERAKLFCGLDDMRKLKYLDTFRAEIMGGEREATVINKIFRDAGFNIRSNSSGAVGGLATVKHVYDAFGREVLVSSVEVFSEAWREEYLKRASLPGQYVAGLAKIVKTTNGSFGKVQPYVVKMLSKTGPSQVRKQILEDNGGTKIRTDQVPEAFARYVSRTVNKMTQKVRDTVPLIDLGALREATDAKGNF
jgi:hypothetical protein